MRPPRAFELDWILVYSSEDDSVLVVAQYSNQQPDTAIEVVDEGSTRVLRICRTGECAKARPRSGAVE